MDLKAKTLCTYLSIDSFEASSMGAGQLLSILTFGFGVAVRVNNVHVTNWLTTPIYIVFRADYRCHDYKRVEMAAQTSFHIQIGSFVSSRCTAEVNQYVNGSWVPLGEIHFHLTTNDNDRFDINTSGLHLNGRYRNEQSQTWRTFLEEADKNRRGVDPLEAVPW